MSDETLRRYETELRRMGRSPLEVGLGLLGLDSTMAMPEFKECQFCESLQGSATLCSGCIIRRDLADALLDVATTGLAPILAIAFAPEKRVSGSINAHEYVAWRSANLYPTDFSENGQRRRDLIDELLENGRQAGARLRGARESREG